MLVLCFESQETRTLCCTSSAPEPPPWLLRATFCDYYSLYAIICYYLPLCCRLRHLRSSPIRIYLTRPSTSVRTGWSLSEPANHFYVHVSFTMFTWRPSRLSPPQIHNHSHHLPQSPPSLSPSLVNVLRCCLIDVYYRHFRKVPSIYHLPESAVPKHQLCPRLRITGGHRRCLFSPHR